MTEWTSSLQPGIERKYSRVQSCVVELAAPLTTAVLQNDSVDITSIPAGYVVKAAMMAPSATLGSSCTAQLRIGTTAITAATTATATTAVAQSVIDVPSTSARTMNILIAGAAITSAATLKVSFIIAAASVVTLPST